MEIVGAPSVAAVTSLWISLRLRGEEVATNSGPMFVLRLQHLKQNNHQCNTTSMLPAR